MMESISQTLCSENGIGAHGPCPTEYIVRKLHRGEATLPLLRLGPGGLLRPESFWLLGKNSLRCTQEEEVKKWFLNFIEHNHKRGK